MKQIGLILFISLCISGLYGQKITPKDVLSTAVKDSRVLRNQQITSFTQGLKYHIPFVKQVEARLGINGSALGDTIYGYIRNEDFYGVQVGFNSFREIKQQKLMKQAQIGLYQSEARVLEQQALSDRYQSLVFWAFSQQLLTGRRELEILLNKKHDILRLMIEKGLDVKVKDVMDTEEDKNSVQLSILSLEEAIILQKNKIKQFLDYPSLPELNTINFITIEKILEVINNSKINPLNHPAIGYKNAKTAFSTSQLNYVNSQNRQILNMARLGYENPLYLERPKNFNTFNNISFRIGLTVPLTGNNNFKHSEALLEQKEAQNEVDILREQLARNVDNQYVKIESLINRYQLCVEKIQQSLIQKMLKNEKLLSQMSPLEVVDLQLTQQKLLLRADELSHDIVSEYVKLLELTGKMSEKPLLNYLSATLENL